MALFVGRFNIFELSPWYFDTFGHVLAVSGVDTGPSYWW